MGYNDDMESHPIPNSPAWHEKALVAFETRSGLSLTLHDRHGVLRDERGRPILPERSRHAHPACERSRASQPGWNTRCFRDCAFRSEALAHKTREPFVKTCWKGVTELVVPVFQGEQHFLTFYAGPFRGEAAPPSTMPRLAWFKRLIHALPVFSMEDAPGIAAALRLLGLGLLAQTPGLHAKQGGRSEQIQQFFRNRSHEPIRLANLAAHLGISASRARHALVEETGMTFRQGLLKERLLRARNLLLRNEDPLERVASAAGFANPFHFSRAFKREYGVAPGRYRSMGPGSAHST
jgi:AraC-like DNA-binding protein